MIGHLIRFIKNIRMYINYLNHFSIKVSGEKGLVWEFKRNINYISFEKPENILKVEFILAKMIKPVNIL